MNAVLLPLLLGAASQTALAQEAAQVSEEEVENARQLVLKTHIKYMKKNYVGEIKSYYD